jgi:hypothetical protein
MDAHRGTFKRRVATNLIVTSVTLLIGVGSGAPVFADPPPGPRRLEGTWAVQVTRRDCQTQAPLGPPILALLTFARGGTMIDSAGSPPPGFAASQRSIGLGTWAHEGGHRFVSNTVMLVHFDTTPPPPAPPLKAGWQILGQQIELTDRDNFTAVASSRFFDAAGQDYRPAGCSTAVGRRFE